MALQTVEDNENEGGARRGPQYCDATPAVHAAQAMLVPQGPPLLHESAVLRGAGAPNGRCLHARLDGVGGEEEEVVRHAGGGAGDSLLPERQRLRGERVLLRLRLGGPLVEDVKQLRRGLLRPEPGRAPASFPQERPHLPMPEAPDALVSVDVLDDGEDARGLRRHGIGVRRHRDLDLALHELDGREHERRKCTRECASEPQRR